MTIRPEQLHTPLGTLPAGTLPAPTPPADAGPTTGRGRVSPAATLAELSREYVLLHHGALLALGVADPLPVIYAETGINDADRPLRLPLERPLLSGLPAPLDRILLLVPRRVWPVVFAHLKLVSYLDRSSRRYWQTLIQEVPVLDQWAVGRCSVAAAQPPTALVYFVGVDGNQCCYHYRPSLDLYQEPVLLRKSTPLPETVHLAASLLASSSDPYAELEKGSDRVPR